MTFLTILGATEILCSFRLVLEGKTSSKEIPESPRLEFLEKFSANNFALSEAEDNPKIKNQISIYKNQYLPMERLSNEHKNSHKLCNETGILL